MRVVGALPGIVFSVTKNTLKIISAVVWLSGAIVLVWKSVSLYAQADALQPGEIWSWLAVAAAILLGVIKAQYLFGGFCRKNLTRIAALENPKLWHAFRPGFYVFLTTMILLGALLSKLAAGNYPALLALVVLDVSIGVALLGSMRVFSQPIN